MEIRAALEGGTLCRIKLTALVQFQNLDLAPRGASPCLGVVMHLLSCRDNAF